MKSMTGFGFAESRDEKRAISVTLKAYNNRFLDMFINLPGDFSALEQKIREYVSQRVLRGRVEMYVKFTEYEQDVELRLDKNLVRAYTELLSELAASAQLEERLRLSHLLKMEGIFQSEKPRNSEDSWPQLEPVLAAAFDQFEEMRAQEGRATREDIEGLLSVVEKELAKIAAGVAEVEAGIREKLRKRFYDLLGEGVDETRVLAETAVLLMKADVNEELVRMQNHLSKFNQVLHDRGAVGKNLDFICQELNREANTIGSKSSVYAVDEAVVNIKDALEKIREQVRNVE
jgi:uncharacterized protein (TIGR00255 family)